MAYARKSYGITLRRACRIVGISDSVYPYPMDISKDDEVIIGLQKEVNAVQLMGSASSSRSYGVGGTDGITSEFAGYVTC